MGWSGSAQADADPFVGTWIMDPRASHLASGRMPEQMVIVMTATADGIHYRSEIKHAGGQTSVTEYTAGYEGSLSMVSGPVGVMAPVALKRLDSRTVEASYVRGLKVVATSRRIASPDGKIMTVTTISSGPDGQTYTNVAVFKRAV
jgi:hypothetical protein